MPTPSSLLGNSLAPTGQQYDIKSGQWFGSVVRSSGEDGTILVRSSISILINAHFSSEASLTLAFPKQSSRSYLVSRR